MTGGGFLNNCTIVKPSRVRFPQVGRSTPIPSMWPYSKHNAFNFPKSLCRNKFYL